MKLSRLLSEAVSGVVAKFGYKTGRKYVLVLGKYMSSKKSKGKSLPTGEAVAGIDLEGVYKGSASDRGHPGRQKKFYPGFGQEGLDALRRNLPMILGYVDGEEITNKPKVNIEAIKAIKDKHGNEGIMKLRELLKEAEVDPEGWRHKIVHPDEMTTDIIKTIENVTSLNMKQRPLKSTTATEGRYAMGRYGIPDSTVNAIFERFYRTYLIGEIKSSAQETGMVGGIILDKLTSLPDIEQSKKLLEAARKDLDNFIENIVPELEEPKPEEPEAPPIEELPPGEPEIEVAEPDEPEYGTPPEVGLAPKGVGAPELEPPEPEDILKSKELQRKPSMEIELPEAPPEAPEEISHLEQEKIKNMAKNIIVKKKLKKKLTSPEPEVALEPEDMPAGAKSEEPIEEPILKQKPKRVRKPKIVEPDEEIA
jgi:hypothetical protein